MYNPKTWAVTLVLGFAVPAFAQHGPGGHVGGPGHGHGAMSNHEDMRRDAATANKSVSERLSDNTKLAARLQSLLPKGTNLQTAASGFKNLGQFVAAVHVSHNLGIPFDQLKAKMLGPPSMSLGKAIQALKPTANAKAELKKAQHQAHQDLDTDKDDDSKKS